MIDKIEKWEWPDTIRTYSPRIPQIHYKGIKTDSSSRIPDLSRRNFELLARKVNEIIKIVNQLIEPVKQG